MRVITKRWGQELWLTDPNVPYQVKRIELETSTSMHGHNKKTETIVVLDGTLHIEWADGREPESLSPGEHVTILPGDAHRMFGNCEYLECTTPDYEASDNFRVPGWEQYT
jgi:quercetin dioxygenase-like cupin family protein